jgi:hypothetical protein
VESSLAVIGQHTEPWFSMGGQPLCVMSVQHYGPLLN